MKTEKKPILIGYDRQAEFENNKRRMEKQSARESLEKYVTNVCKLKIPDYSFFQNDIKTNFKTLFDLHWRNRLPEGIERDKMYFLASIDINKVHSLIEHFESIEILETGFGIYAQNHKQATAFNLLSKVCESVENCKSNEIQVFIGSILQAFNGYLYFDHYDQKLKPNPMTIQQIK